MPVNVDELARLMTGPSLPALLRATRLLVAVLSDDGRLLIWNPAFDALRHELHEVHALRDALALASRTVFDLLLSTVTHDRIPAQGELDLGQGQRLSGYACFLYPIADGRVLFVAEPSHASADLESLSEQLQRTRQSLERKETELQSVLARAGDLSSMDALTALPNRRQCLVQLQEAVQFSDQYGTLLAVLMIDIDHFQKLNDTHGHAAGDEVLRRLAGALRPFIRPPEVIGRYGGEEFLVILPHYTVDAALEQARRLAAEARALQPAEGPLGFTVSIGVAQHRVRQADWQQLLERVKRAVEQAKARGRDRCEVAAE